MYDILIQCGAVKRLKKTSPKRTGTAKAHFSFRVARKTLARLQEYARHSGEAKGSLVERYVEEGLRMDAHPGIVFVSGPAGRRPAVSGTGLDVWEVVCTVKDAGSTEDASRYLGIDPGKVDAALGYYADFREDIDAWIERVGAEAERVRQRWRHRRSVLA